MFGESDGRSFGFNSIRWRLILVICLVVIMGMVTTVVYTTREIRHEANLASIEKVRGDLQLGEALLDSRYPGPWEIRDGRLYKGDYRMNGNFEIVDEIGRLTGDTCTIFQGDTRVATNVMREGYRAVGTKVSDEVGQVVLAEGREYYGEAEVVGIKYQTAYKPIRNANGEIIGIWYVGANKQFVDKMVNDAVRDLVSIFGFVLILTVSGIWFMTNSLTKPVNHLVLAANRLARGELDTSIVVKSNNEIGHLAGSFELMRLELRQQYSTMRKTNELLQETERRFREMLKSVRLLSVILDRDGNITFCNDFLLKVTGWQREEIIGRNWVDTFIPPENRESVKKLFNDVTRGILPTDGEKEIVTRSGECRLIDWNNTILRDLQGNVAGLARIGEDVTERKRAEDELRNAHQQLLDIIEFLPDATFVIDRNRRVIAWNRAIEELSGVPKDEMVGQGDFAYAVPFFGVPRPMLIDLVFERNPNVERQYDYLEDRGSSLFAENFVPLANQGKGAVLWASASPLFDVSGNMVGAIETIRDITERKRIEERLQHLATHDSLTNIPNRYSLEENLRRVIARAKRKKHSALLFIDLDNFKLVNDTLGHATGDELLVNLSGILKRNLREGDFLARLGGDEFAVLLEDTTAEEARFVAEKLRRAVDEVELCLATYRFCFNLSISIGVVLIDGSLDSHRVLSSADAALYAAKEKGRNRVSFVDELDIEQSKLTETNEMVSLIKSAIKEDRLVLYYQPVVSVKSGMVVHHEALIRMQNRDGALISPGRFIPVAERFGLMPQIDQWVVRSSLESLKKYPDPLALHKKVNPLSRLKFAHWQ